MKQRTKGGGSSAKSTPPRAVTGSTSSSSKETSTGKKDGVKSVGFVAERSTLALFTLCILLVNGVWGVYHYQHENLPAPMTRDQAGKRGFSEHEAMKHVEALSGLGPHPVGSDALERAVQYVVEAAEAIKKSAHWEVDVEVDLFHVKSGTNILVGGLFNGKSLVYSDLSHVVLKITPKYAPEAGDNAILVSSHIDSVFAGEGAGDCSSCVAVMLELARGVSQWAQGFKNSVIFLFNTGEEEGLNGAHSFMTQHPWSDSVRLAIDLEAMGIGGKSSIFQTGSDPWAIENFALVAKYPAAQIVAEDLFNSGLIKSATDFQVYKELGGLSGLDFAYTDNTAVYHTKNDKLKLLKPGSLQHLGENMLAFLRHAGGSSSLPKDTAMQSDSKSSKDRAIYFDIMGTYMVTYRQSLANMLYNSVIMQSLLIWATSVKMGGSSAAISLVLSFLSNIFMWVCSVGFASVVAFILPFISSSPVPYVSSPWLVLGLFAAPALLGAFTGQHVGFLILKSYLSRTLVETKRKLPDNIKDSVIKLDAERWLYKAGLLQWLVLLMVGNYFKIGASYLALVWLVSPAFAYGLLEATLSPTRMPKPLKTATLMIGLFVPFLLTSGMVIRISGTVIGTSVRFIRNPGSTPDWLINVILAVLIAAIVCLTMVYLLSYVHISGAKLPLIVATVTMFAISLGAVWGGFIPPFTDDIARAVNVVHVIDATGLSAIKPEPVSYISLFSTTPGNLIKEAEHIGEGFVCGRDRYLDFVTFSTNYSCWMDKGAESGWHKSDIPEIQVESDSKGKSRQTLISMDTKVSTRWVLGINTEEIEDFQLKDADNSEELIPFGDKTAVDGWHTIQFSGGKNAPTKFSLSLIWTDADTKTTSDTNKRKDNHLLRLRTDVDHLTPPVKNVLEKLPSWCSLFGKSTSPHTLAFLNSLPVEF